MEDFISKKKHSSSKLTALFSITILNNIMICGFVNSIEGSLLTTAKIFYLKTTSYIYIYIYWIDLSKKEWKQDCLYRHSVILKQA